MIDLVIISGASSGIGASIFDSLINNKKKHIIAIYNKSKIYSSKKDENTKISKLKLDLKNILQVEKKILGLVKYKKIKSLSLILAAGSLGHPGGVFNSDIDDWINTFKINLAGNLSIIKSCKKIILKGVKTRIVFFGGGGAAYGYPEFTGYSLSKVSIIRLVENLSIEFKKLKLNASVVALAPGAIKTPMLAKVIKNGGQIKTLTEINEPVKFVNDFISYKLDKFYLNGRFVHVRDNLEKLKKKDASNLFLLRRVE